ncbi:glutamate--tRNA ligase [Sediminibacterium sp.]|uniref:glutamate--tRNA ligase n=1 Tax=Sediminibacterium sp. TaxID=1917865 RepID=UPI002732E9ED|nr:glutamate--tRNA ligase [Sediminibacterium sp.]MDP3392197.1 glutamate--tRNA ligase [Sediminibacterium sp.]MDP3567001.1 glutamate--tRNA ligase [Sediminibacterium sp.]
MEKKVRVRFAPSPTGGLHLGGVRTVLFNYLFAKKHGGDFIVRIEDTDQTRFVEGAEEYIFNTLAWCGLTPDESPLHGGPYAPYRQSERKASYKQYADQLVQAGYAYYAFDTPAELEKMRAEYKTDENPSPQYNHLLRTKMHNSLTLSEAEVSELLAAGTPHVVRIKMPLDETVSFTDMIRGEVSFNTSQVDDKVLLKADGMPTYHLAVVVDDYLMKITHAFRGEEWLPSAPVHILLWKYLGWSAEMPQWAHLPLILKPDGNGKLSKRDGDRLGFPVFAMDWTDPKTGETTIGFKERGFLPEAFVNLLALLGWNDGTDNEVFTMDELIAAFSMERVHKGGAKFNYEKALWYNQEWIKRATSAQLVEQVAETLAAAGVAADGAILLRVIDLVKERCTLMADFVTQGSFFFVSPSEWDTASIQPKWNDQKNMFFIELAKAFESSIVWEAHDLENTFKEITAAHGLKPGELMLPLRIMLVGGKFGPGVFDIAEIIGKQETVNRIQKVLSILEHN